MKSFESNRTERIENYVFITQVLFFLLLGILMIRIYNPLTVTPYFFMKNNSIIFTILGVVFVKVIQKKWEFTTQKRVDNFLNLLYLVLCLYLLYYEEENFFTFLVIMPVIVNSLQFGFKVGSKWAVLTSVIISANAVFKEKNNIDLDILLIGIIWLFAWLLGKMSDTERKIREDLADLASLDGLTGIYNHRSFHDLLEEFILQAKDEKTSLTLIIFDVDYFKYYNDSYGHLKGDEVLRKIAMILRNSIEPTDICARYGGEEFTVILPDCAATAGVRVAEKIRKLIEQYPFEGAEILPKGRLTVSMGVASFPEQATTKEELIQLADEAMYKAKCTTKNKVELYHSVLDEIATSLQEKERDTMNSIRTFLMVVNAKDRYTYGHSERTMQYAQQIGKRLSLWEWEIQELAIGALLHDIGKIEVPREILNKPGRLTLDEWQAIRHHPIWGADMIRPISSLANVVEIVLYHHENFDGTGYPMGLAGQDIPIGARILRVVDSFDAMTTNRPYKIALTMEEALLELQSYSGIHYDPEVVQALVAYISETGITSSMIAAK